MTRELSDIQDKERMADHALVSAVLEKYLAYMHAWEAHEDARKNLPFDIGHALGEWHDKLKEARASD